MWRALSAWQLLAEQNYLQSFPQLRSSFCVFISPGSNAIQNAVFIFNLNYCIFWTINLTVEIPHQLPIRYSRYTQLFRSKFSDRFDLFCMCTALESMHDIWIISNGIILFGHNLQNSVQARKFVIYWEKTAVTNVSWRLERFSLRLRFPAFMLSWNGSVRELKVLDIEHNTVQHTNIPCEKIPFTSICLLPSRGSIEPILIIITCEHHPRDRKSLKNEMSQKLSADQ